MKSSHDLLSPHVPPAAVAYCKQLQIDYGFCFRVSKPRRSKWGDYRYQRSGQQVRHTITVNQNLNPYAFLITYLHEVAHRVAFEQYGFRIKPHGKAWKRCFEQLLTPVLTEVVFPADVLRPLRHYAQRPRASTGADPILTLALRCHDAVSDHSSEVPLSSLAPTTSFRFRQRVYVKKQVRRTRSLCQEIATKKNYLILETTLVERIHYANLTP